MKFKSFAFACSVAIFLTACGGGDGDASVAVGKNGTVDIASAALPAGADCGIGNMPQQLLAAINAARAQARMCGGTSFPAKVSIPYWNTKLADASLRHSTDMATKEFFSHTGSDGSADWDRIQATGYGSPGVGEILMRMEGGSPSIDRAMKSWLGSPGHCSVIMDSGSRELGAACVKKGSVAYMTVEFGN